MSRSAAAAVLASTALVMTAVAPAAAQAPAPEIGTWAGTYRSSGKQVRMRVVLTRLQIGARAGRTRYAAPDGTCRGRLTLRARTAAGYVLRDRLVSGPRSKCTDGDTLVVRAIDANRLRVKVRNGGDTLRIVLRRR